MIPRADHSFTPQGGAAWNAVLDKLDVSVSNFGGVGDGVTDVSVPWANLVAEANTQVSAAIASGFPITTYKVILEAGDYVINFGTSVVNCNLIIEGKGKENTRVRIGSGAYLLTVSNVIYQLELRGVTFSGGKGVLNHTLTTGNTLGKMVVADCNFQDYTECAIGSLSSDFPYVTISRNIFIGTTALTSKGVAFAGLVDGHLYEDNAFQRNKYHIKLAAGGNNAKLKNNDFIRYTSGGGSPALTDVWLVPNSSINNSGTGLVIADNKFGNELLSATDKRILVADEDAGTDFVTKDHSTNASSGWVSGIQTRGNSFFGTGSSPSVSFIYSYTPNLQNCRFQDLMSGTPAQYVEYSANSTSNNSRFNTQNTLDLSLVDQAPAQLVPEASALYAGLVNDPFGYNEGRKGVYEFWRSGSDPSFVSNGPTTLNAGSGWSAGDGSAAQATDAISGTDAIEFTATAAGAFYSGSISPALSNGRVAFIEFDIKAGSSLSLNFIEIGIRETVNFVEYGWYRKIAVPTYWKRVRFPFVLRDEASDYTQILFFFTDYVAATRTKVQLGRMRIYSAHEPVHMGARHLEATASWNPGDLPDGDGETSAGITVTGAALGDFVMVAAPYDLQGITCNGYVSATNTVKVRLQNETTGSINLADGVWRVRVLKADI